MPERFSRKKLKTVSQIALAAYWAFMLVGTHLPPSALFLPVEVDNLDKLYHASTYALLAALLATTWQLSAGRLNAGHLFWTWITIVAVAAIDEITQIPFNRDCSFWDWSADATGAAIGLIAFAWLRKKISARGAQRE
jgi:VanZ family protein